MTHDTAVSRRGFLGLLGAAGAFATATGLIGCGGQSEQSGQSSESEESTTSSNAATTTGGIAIDAAAWSYDADNDVYYQIGVQYCENPQAPTYESMGIYVPGAYFDATDNGDGTFTCTPSSTGTVAGYTAATAPIVMPINTAGYSSQAAPTAYSANGITSYLEAGFVYVYAGCRGRKMEDDACGAAPWGVTDLKAAVRTLRYNADALPGDKDRIFSFGHSGGGAQSAVLGATGDAEGYDDYLAAIGALNGDNAWITYDESTNIATITGLAGFVAACKSPSKDVGAFDALDRSQAENEVFGDVNTEGLHFDAVMATLLAGNADAYAKLSDWDADYPDAYEDDRAITDAQGKSSDFRQELYDPICYLSDAYEAAGTSTPAAHWRIRTGITQGDTALTTEMNLALALAADKRVEDVDFATVWGQGHTMAERTGSSTSNFIAWVNACCS